MRPQPLDIEAVTKLAEELGIDSVSELARRSGIDRPGLSRILSGKRRALPSHVNRLAVALGVNAESLRRKVPA